MSAGCSLIARHPRPFRLKDGIPPADAAEVTKLRALVLGLLVSLAVAAPAAAGGPVFVVVPTTPSEASASAPANGELSADRHALAQARRASRTLHAKLARVERRAASAVLLSDQLAAEQRAAQLRAGAEGASARVSELRQEIAQLEVALQPPPLQTVVPLATAVPSSTTGITAISIADQFLGVPYRWGGADPLTGFDCSGLTMYVYAQLGIQLPHYAADQWQQLPHVDASQLEPGDLVFFEPRANGPGHVGIFAGGDNFIEAPHTGDVVKIASLSQEAAMLGYVGAARPSALAGSFFGYY
jgi:cell wall-associated NlpC family hydrolase